MPVPKKPQVLDPNVKSQVQKLIREEFAAMDFPSRAELVELEQRMRVLGEQCEAHLRVGVPGPSTIHCASESLVDFQAKTTRPTLRHLRTSMLDENTMGRLLQESVWEIPVMIGFSRDHPHLFGTFSDSLLLCVALLINLFVQFLFCVVIFEFLLRRTQPELDDIERWRETSGHSLTNVDPSTYVSLVSRVCAGDETLIYATSQKTLREEIVDYTQKLGPLHAGLIVFCLCAFIWGLEAVRELRIAQSFASFLYAIPVKDHTLIDRVDDTEFGITAISRKRKTIGLALTALRAAIAASLWVMGAAWLAHTTSLENMILNCAALSVVLGTDEALYAALAPLQVKSAVQYLLPLQLRVRSSRALIVIPVVELLALAGYLVAFLLALALPNFHTWSDIDAALCNGEQKFIWTNTSLGVFVVGSTPSPDDQEGESYQRSAVRNEIWGSTPQLAYVSDVPPQDLRQWNLYPESAMTTLFVNIITPADCVDIPLNLWTDDVGNFSWLVHYLRKQTGIANASSCADVQDFCGNISFRLLRTACPSTCGCGSIRGGVFLLDTEFGCPASANCRPYKSLETQTLNCTQDVPTSNLTSMPVWHSFWRQYVEYAAMVQAANQSTRMAEVLDIRQNGCTWLSLDAKQYFCSESFQPPPGIFVLSPSPATRGHIAGFCPRSCDCENNNFCPSIIFDHCKPAQSPRPSLLPKR